MRNTERLPVKINLSRVFLKKSAKYRNDRNARKGQILFNFDLL